MTAGTVAADDTSEAVLHSIEFRGSGNEYFRIWIVNLALTVITLGIYGAWAKVRTLRYLRGNTFLAGHPFDYHASAVRILIGRLIAVSVLLGYGISARIHPVAAVAWVIFFLFVTPWLVVSSLRFNARNTSYRNVRFNFVGSIGAAARAYILWPVLSTLTLLTTWPLVHRVRDYYFVNNHTYGGKAFHTRFSGWSIYRIYLIALAGFFVVGVVFAGFVAWPLAQARLLHTKPDPKFVLLVIVLYVVALIAFLVISTALHAMSTNLALNHTTLDGRHRLVSKLQPLRMAWIVATNGILTLVTIGIFYPWGRVRLFRYETSRLAVLAASDLDEFTSETVATQGAIGEEIASFFDLGIGL